MVEANEKSDVLPETTRPLAMSVCSHSLGRGALSFRRGVLSSVSHCKSATQRKSQAPRTVCAANVATPTSLRELLDRAPSVFQSPDIALLNLLSAQTLPGTVGLDVQGCLAMLDQWATRVKSETERHLYRYRRNPAEFDNSEGYFRMLMMAVVLYEDFGVRYNPERIIAPESVREGDRFFADSSDLFLHGLLGSKRMGTCSSLPVLYIALGRRLGYPLKLVTTKGHLFVRWKGRMTETLTSPQPSPLPQGAEREKAREIESSERFNVEATGKGMNRYDDEHFKRWPFELTEEEIAANGFLKSLTAEEELAVFLSIRAQCLIENGRQAEAVESLTATVRFAPHCEAYRRLLAQTMETLATLTNRPRAAVSNAVPLQPTFSEDRGIATVTP